MARKVLMGEVSKDDETATGEMNVKMDILKN